VRLSVGERYSSRQEYLDRATQAAEDLVRQRFLRGEDVPAILLESEEIWNAVVGSVPR
jgi:hypothetical protein